MRIFHSITEYREAAQKDADLMRMSAVTPGKFDGVHLGHQKLLAKAAKRRAESGCLSIVLAIDVNPVGILSPEEREGFLASLGTDILVECPLSEDLMRMSPEEFVRHVLVDSFHAEYVAVGTDYRFGFHRAGDARMLLDLQEKYGFEAEIVDKEMYEGEEISSTRVRKALADGDMKLCQNLLGRPYPISGTVRHGKKIGRTIGFPTVNQTPPPYKLLPPDGVYASRVTIEEGGTYRGVTNIGTNPTVGGSSRSVETYLFGMNADLYGRRIRTDLIQYQRGEIRFGSLEELQAQMQKDKAAAQNILAAEEQSL